MISTHPSVIAIAIVVSLAAAACNDSAETGNPSVEPSAGPSFAIALSDYESAGVAIMDGDGKVLSKKFISSGTELAGLSSALHGDIALPTQACTPGMLTVVARMGGDYILQVDLQEGKVVRQIPAQGSTGGVAYSSNPQDILCLDDGQALVTRFEPNLAPKPDELDLGDDILRIDLDGQKRQSRIDLSKFRGTVERRDSEGNPVRDTAYARPGSIARVGGYAVVVLSRLTADYAAAEGMLAIVDLETDEATGFELPTVRNCSALIPVAGRDDAVVVSCAGSPYGDAATAGLLLASIDANGKARVEHTYQAREGMPTIYAAPVSIGGTRVVAVATGDFTKMTPDIAYVVDLDSGETTELVTSGSAGELGVGAGGVYRHDTGLLMLPDAGQGIHQFKVTDDEVVQTGVVELDPTLPARGIRPLVRF